MPPMTFVPRTTAEKRFERLVRPHYDVLYRTAWRWTRSVTDAEDLVQETCVRAFPRLAEIERLDRPRSWLLRVMYRLFVDLTRRHDRRRVVPLEQVSADNLVCDRYDPEQGAERARNAERVARAWQRLDGEKRVLLALHDIEGYTLAEMVEITGVKEGTLKSRLHRSRALLGRMLDPDYVVTERRAGSGGTKP
jgi:RNA polymerase sigma-70 factor (ECF subfamily)